MITVIAQNNLKPGAKVAMVELAKELVDKSCREPGNYAYNLFEDVNDENVVTIIEQWETPEALEAHTHSEHFGRILPQMEQYFTCPTQLHVYRRLY